MSIWHFDFETTSQADITNGAWRYASDPSTRILMFAIVKDDGTPKLWRFDDPSGEESVEAFLMLQEVIASGEPLYSHNYQFELAICTYRLKEDVGLEPPSLEQLRCTQAMCRRAAIPASLAKASEFLRLGEDKDKRGKALIGIFSDQTKPISLTLGKEKRKSSSPILESPVPWEWTMTVAGDTMTVRDAWNAFCEYCRQDVVVERVIHKALASFEIKGAELEGFQFDGRMNFRGVPVNVPALEVASKIVEAHQSKLSTEFYQLTGLMPSQTARVLEWLKLHGYPGDNLTADTMEKWNGSDFLDAEGKRALEIRSLLSFAAVKKIKKALDVVCPNGQMRGSFTWYGAQRTGRWTSQGVQLQNARKPTIPNPDDAYADICAGMDYELFSMMHDNPYEAVASVVRNFVQPKDGAMILDFDYANIESRVAALIAGQESMLQAYRDGRDLYRELATVIFNVPMDQVTKDQRFVAKTASLACIYQTGAKTFHETCAMWGMPIEKSLACHTVKTFRQTNDQFPITWRKFESAAAKALKEPGKWIEANEFVSFAYSHTKPFPRLLMKLMSGRSLCYPYPQVKRTVKTHRDYETGETREWESDEISFYGALRGHAGWGRVSTYAGDLFQSAVQGTARDIMQHGLVTAEKAGYETFMCVHDQALAHDGDLDGFRQALCSHPSWLPDDFPLASEGQRCAYYSK